MAADVLKEHGALHLELADAPTAWCYYGRTLEEAERGGGGGDRGGSEGNEFFIVVKSRFKGRWFECPRCR